MPSKGEQLRRWGFDLSEYNRSDGTWTVRCSQCEALVVQGQPTHERGCPNSGTGGRRHRYKFDARRPSSLR